MPLCNIFDSGKFDNIVCWQVPVYRISCFTREWKC